MDIKRVLGSWLLSERARIQEVGELEAWALLADLLVSGEQTRSLQIHQIENEMLANLEMHLGFAAVWAGKRQ